MPRRHIDNKIAEDRHRWTVFQSYISCREGPHSPAAQSQPAGRVGTCSNQRQQQAAKVAPARFKLT